MVRNCIACVALPELSGKIEEFTPVFGEYVDYLKH